jgi:hypothetical protein
MPDEHYKIIRSHASLVDLEKRVNAVADYEPAGGPFRDPDAREWCQAVILRREPVPAGEVRLREPDSRKRR